jgi:uncharacterized protein YyaL (SSP411 family)
MMVGDAFASSLDADSEGEEGKFYVWDAAEIDEALDPTPRLQARLRRHRSGNWEHKNVLNRLHEPGLPDPDEADLLRRCRERLLEVRHPAAAGPRRQDAGRLERPHGLGPRRGRRLPRPPRLGRPRRPRLRRGGRADAVGEDGLVHSWREGRRLELGFLDDYAQMSRAAVALFGQTGDTAYLDQARAWLARADAEFLDPETGAYFQNTPEAGLIVRPRNAHDGPYPPATARWPWSRPSSGT